MPRRHTVQVKDGTSPHVGWDSIRGVLGKREQCNESLNTWKTINITSKVVEAFKLSHRQEVE